MTKLHYCGDVNIEHGGFFYAFGDPWATVVRCTPCSDAGGPDNMFWIEVLYVHKPEGEDRRQVLVSWGLDEEGFNKIDPKVQNYVLLEACVSYGHYDQMSSECIRIGKPDPFYGGREQIKVDRVVRAGTNLHNLVKRQAYHHCF